MSATIWRSSATGKPSSRTKAADSASGRAPMTATSLTVPWTARCPIDPPGKRSGLTTKESVLKISRSPEGRARQAPSANGASRSLAKASAKTASIRLADALPPAPWASVMISSVNRGRRRRKLSIRSRTAASSVLSGPVGRPGVARVGHGVSRMAWIADHSSKTSAAWVSWMRWTLSAAHDQAVVETGLGHLAPVVAGQADGEQAPPAALGEGVEEVDRVAAGRQPKAMSPGAAVGDELAGEHQLEADVVAQGGEDGLVGDERAGREGPTPRGPAEERGQAGGVGGAAPVAEGEKPGARPGTARRSRWRPAPARGRMLAWLASRSAQARRGLGVGRRGEVE